MSSTKSTPGSGTPSSLRELGNDPAYRASNSLSSLQIPDKNPRSASFTGASDSILILPQSVATGVCHYASSDPLSQGNSDSDCDIFGEDAARLQEDDDTEMAGGDEDYLTEDAERDADEDNERGKLPKDKRARGDRGRGKNSKKGAGKKAKEILLRPSTREAGGGGGENANKPNKCNRGSGKVARKSGSTSRRKDPMLKEQTFHSLGPVHTSEPENQALCPDARAFVVELCQICHRFLTEAPNDNPDHPLNQVIRMLEYGSLPDKLDAHSAKHVQDAYSMDSLETFAMRCNLAEQNIALSTFSFMLNAVQFRCKVIRYASIDSNAGKYLTLLLDSDCKQKGWKKSRVLKNCKYQGRTSDTLAKYVLEGAKFCLLAGGGMSFTSGNEVLLILTFAIATIFILAFAASGGMLSKIRQLPHDVVLRVYYLLRSPNPGARSRRTCLIFYAHTAVLDHPLGKLVIQDIIPAVRAMQKRCDLVFGRMFNESLLISYGALPFKRAGDMTRSDEFFDNITFK